MILNCVLHVPPTESRLSFPIGQAPCTVLQLTVSLKRVIKSRWQERVAPEREEWGWDTGWGFFSDDDDEIEDDENGGFYDIRDICRIDPTVVPLLSLPYGTCMEKDETGEWIEIEDDETERS